MSQQNSNPSMQEAQNWYVCGLIIQAKVENFSQIQQQLLDIPYTEISAVDEKQGKLVVVMQSSHHRQLADNMEYARRIEGVIDLSLVYHEQDEQDA